MNESEFLSLLQQVDESDWKSVGNNRGILLIDDERLEIGPADHPHVIITRPTDTPDDTDQFTADTLANAASILADYYRTSRLSRKSFDQQVKALIQEHGSAEFCAPTGELPNLTLFVDGGEVIAETADNPRHKYGLFYELLGDSDRSSSHSRLENWLASGEAYGNYLAINVPL